MDYSCGRSTFIPPNPIPFWHYFNRSMSYKFVVRVYQTNTNAFFKPVETSVYKAGTWSNNDGEHILLLGYDTSAAIRLDAGSEHVVVLLGNHDKNVWCDIDTDIGGKSSAQLNMQYYDGQARERDRKKFQRIIFSQLISSSIDISAKPDRNVQNVALAGCGHVQIYNLVMFMTCQHEP
ncbi:Lectin [Pleurotus pulmonarius]